MVPLNVKIEPIAGKEALLVILDGRIDDRSLENLSGPIQAALGKKVCSLLIDLTGVAYVSSKGAAYFMTLNDTLKENGKKLILVGLKPAVKSVFKLLEFDKFVQIFSDRDTAANQI